VNEVEMLLEAYFIQVDNTHNKLQTLHEYIDDTEVRQPVSVRIDKFSKWTSCAVQLLRHPSEPGHDLGFLTAFVAYKHNQNRCQPTIGTGSVALVELLLFQASPSPLAQDYINIELDSHRNQLIQLELLLTAAMFAMALVTVVAGLFGMNLYNKAEDSYVAFILVSSHWWARSLFGKQINPGAERGWQLQKAL